MIYTSIIGNIDSPRTDIKNFAEGDLFSSDRKNSKLYKILSHLFVPGTSIWVDGNIFPTSTEPEIESEFLGDADMGLFGHSYRKNAIQDALESFNCRKETWDKVNAFVCAYSELIKTLPLYECGFIIRRNNERVRRFNEIWWSLICRWSFRDQLTAPIAAKESGVNIRVSPGNVRNHPKFRWIPHKA